jgi:hypothetical protein
VFIVVVYFIIDWVRKLLGTHSYTIITSSNTYFIILIHRLRGIDSLLNISPRWETWLQGFMCVCAQVSCSVVSNWSLCDLFVDVCIVIFCLYFYFLNFVCSWDTRRWIKSKNTIRLGTFSLLLPLPRDSSVGIALGYRLDDRGSKVRFPAGAGNFSLHHRVQNGSGPTHLPIQWVLGALSLGVKRPRREADHSSPSGAEVKEWVELYLHSPIRLNGVVFS